MPTAKNVRSRSTKNQAVEEPESEEQAMLEMGELETIASDTTLTFFDLLNAIPDANWETPQLRLYIYRIDPPVSNRSGEYAYISRVARPIDEDWLKNEHGGGKYQLLLKHDHKTLRKSTFTIEGQPKFLEGQTVKTGSGRSHETAPPNAAPADNQIADIVRQVIQATGGNKDAAAAGMEVMKKAFTDGLELQRTITTSQIGSATGNPLADKILTAAIENMNKSGAGAPTPNITEQITLITTIAKLFKPEQSNPHPQPPQESISSQLSLVKEIFGVESLGDLINMRRVGSETPWYVGLIQNAIEKAPVLLQQWGLMQEKAFERAIIAAQVRGQLQSGQPGPPVTLQTSTVAAPQPQVVPPTRAPAGSASEQMVAAIVQAITHAYDEGYDGSVAAAHVKLMYPELVELLKPLFMDPAQLAGFVASMPELKDRAQDVEWREFEQDFIAEILQQSAPPATIPLGPTTVAPANGSAEMKAS